MYPRRNVWIMSFSVLLTITAIFSWYRVLANLLRDLGADVGLAFMILTLANRLPSVLGGLLADRVGRKRMLVIGTVLMAPMYAVAAFMHSWTGILVALVDQPGLKTSTVRRLLTEHRRHPEKIIVAACRERRGHPVVFPRKFFKELLRSPLSKGARTLVQTHLAERRTVETGDPAVVRDVDTREQYKIIR